MFVGGWEAEKKLIERRREHMVICDKRGVAGEHNEKG